MTMKERIQHQKEAVLKRKAQRDQLLEERVRLQGEIASLKDTSLMYEATRLLLQKVAADARESARKRLEDTVTDALKYVFGPDFQFVIELKEARGRTEAEFYVESQYAGKVVKTKPEEARGGGVVDIISIALRVALIQVYNHPAIRGPIILDEPGKHVSADYSMKLADFLQNVSRTFGRQIIISTHQPDLANIAETTHLVELKGGQSHVSRPTNP